MHNGSEPLELTSSSWQPLYRAVFEVSQPQQAPSQPTTRDRMSSGSRMLLLPAVAAAPDTQGNNLSKISAGKCAHWTTSSLTLLLIIKDNGYSFMHTQYAALVISSAKVETAARRVSCGVSIMHCVSMITAHTKFARAWFRRGCDALGNEVRPFLISTLGILCIGSAIWHMAWPASRS